MSFKKTIPLLMALLLGISMFGLPMSYAVPTFVKFYADVTQLGDAVTMPDVRGSTFTVALVIENVQDLYGFDIQFNWTTQWVHYTGYSVKIPVDTNPGPYPPSPYGGILWKGPLGISELANQVDEADGIPGAEIGTMAWLGFSEKGADVGTFNGSGTVAVFDFTVIDQPFDYEEPLGVTVLFHITSSALSDRAAHAIDHVAQDLSITLYPRVFSYPAVPMLKVLPVDQTGALGSTVEYGVWLLGADGHDLDAFWDVAGADFYLNFDPTKLQALELVTDPNGTFGGFWSAGTFELVNQIDNTAGFAHCAFTGLGATHTPVSGTMMVAAVKLNVTAIFTTYPPPKTPITLENPLETGIWYIMDADAGIISLSAPLNNNFTSIFPTGTFPSQFKMTDYTDVDLDGKLSIGDDVVMLNYATSKWHDYRVADLKGTLKLTQLFTKFSESKFAMDGPVNKYTPWPKLYDSGTADGLGVPDATGNFSLQYPVQTITKFLVEPQSGAPSYELVDGVDFIVYPDGIVNLLTPLDEHIDNELLGTMPAVDAGWPALDYIASSFTSVWIEDNVTHIGRYANGGIFEEGPPGPSNSYNEWWYESWFPYELESWWATGYYPGAWVWPDGTDIYLNYTVPAWVTIEYNAQPDVRPFYMEFEGSYDDFLTLLDPVNTTWMEIYPVNLKVWNLTEWVDTDFSGGLSNGDQITMTLGALTAVFTVDKRSTDIKVLEYPCVQDIDTTKPYYCEKRIVEVAGFPHPERSMSPWFGRDYGIPLPCAVENGYFTSPFKSLGRNIDLYTDYPYGFNGKDEYGTQIDAYGPQSTIHLEALVTYAENPVQHKPVTFVASHGIYNFSFCNFTDEFGIAWVEFGLPWPCQDAELLTFGIWNISASVSIREVTVTDSHTFLSGWLITIDSITPNPDSSFAIGDHLSFTIKYSSISHQVRSAVFTLVVTDDLDVPIAWWSIGPMDVVFGDGQTLVIECVQVPKWTFVGQGKVWANIYTDFPINGGVQYGPEGRTTIGLTIH
jgi:hypothetical protein